MTSQINSGLLEEQKKDELRATRGPGGETASPLFSLQAGFLVKQAKEVSSKEFRIGAKRGVAFLFDLL